MTIGDRIRRIRKKRRLTQAELAMMSGLSLSAIQGYEQGRYEPKRKSLESIAEVFKIPVDELYDMPAQLGTDCISRQQAIDALKGCYCGGEDSCGEPWIYESHAIKAIKQLPPIQPEIVRCKDCKHHWTHKCMDSMPIERCDLEQTFYDAEVDYCSLAERRKDG